MQRLLQRARLIAYLVRLRRQHRGVAHLRIAHFQPRLNAADVSKIEIAWLPSELQIHISHLRCFRHLELGDNALILAKRLFELKAFTSYNNILSYKRCVQILVKLEIDYRMPLASVLNVYKSLFINRRQISRPEIPVFRNGLFSCGFEPEINYIQHLMLKWVVNYT